MCWNSTISLNTFLFSSFVALLALYNEILIFPKYIFAMSFISIQLIEFVLWKNINNISINILFSKIALILVLLQPVFSILTIQTQKNLIIPLIVLYSIFIILLFYYKPWSTINFRSIPALSGHLSWKWLDYKLIIVLIWLLFLTLTFAIDKEWIKYIFILILFTISYILYHSDLTWGSLWCWIANILAFYWLYRIFKKDICLKLNK